MTSTLVKFILFAVCYIAKGITLLFGLISYGIYKACKGIGKAFSNASKKRKTESVSSKSSRYVSLKVVMQQIDAMDGYEFEQYVAYLLQVNGFTNVGVTKKSGDYGVDIIGNREGNVYAFQCKRFHSKVGVKSVQEIVTGAKMYNANVMVVVTNSYFTQAAQNLARANGVLLWDRRNLMWLIPPVNKTLGIPMQGTQVNYGVSNSYSSKEELRRYIEKHPN